ncbi:uncharacterized protein LOC125873410 [Solanum stenotomum]|uniref:uncharacterized protein LOC125873410 n=1 Tax=Solanum stenotomum TaxID=172797 RepID=UPI0020D151BF|nr:uncharacterized protein LOC125873410 [Solanum stenotomum]
MKEYILLKKNGNKRTREDSGLDSVFDSKRVHIEATAGSSSVELNRVELELEVNSYDSSKSNQEGHVSSPDCDECDTDVDVDSPEAKQIREDILDILDEPETVGDGVPENQDLDSVIKSFEEEILHRSTLPSPHTLIDLTLSDSGESQSDLGYLLEASDDELGLPPSFSPENHIDSESRLENTIGFENELLRYDSFDLGMLAGIMDGDNYGSENDGDFVTEGGLFDYADPSNFSELSLLPESLPAL